jgi:hypothetical protein
MYATCLFCHKPLGRNESVESFPVGERLAFDAAKGRLWVVCPACERWNLSPLEERWEAIEASEKLYRDARRRVATDNIGLAKLRDGTTLVRIGEPLRPEFAAWRYGDQFGRRRKRQILVAGGGVAALGALVTGGAAAGVGIGAFGWMVAQAGHSIIRGNPETIVATIRTDSAGLIHVRRRHLGESTISPGPEGSLALDLRFKNGKAHFEGPEAARIAAIVIPKVNRFGGSRRAVAQAVQEIEQFGSAERYMEHLASMAPAYTRVPTASVFGRRRSMRWRGDVMSRGLFGLPGPHRLALEMALHEEAERRALQGQLEELERAWRDAEEIAAISDNLLLPDAVSSAVRKMKGE